MSDKTVARCLLEMGYSLQLNRKIEGGATALQPGCPIPLYQPPGSNFDQLLFAGNADPTEHAARHLAEHGFHDVQPGAMLWRKHELKTLWVKLQPGLRFFGDMCRMIVEQQTNPGLEGISLVQLCVQQRLACSVGNRPTEAKVRSLVAWMAGRRETKFLKPIDGIIFRMMASHRAVTKVNAEVASKVNGPRGRAHNWRVKAA